MFLKDFLGVIRVDMQYDLLAVLSLVELAVLLELLFQFMEQAAAEYISRDQPNTCAPPIKQTDGQKDSVNTKQIITEIVAECFNSNDMVQGMLDSQVP